MKCVIFQYWDGELTPSAMYSAERMKIYAEAIGADYTLVRNRKVFTGIGKASHYYGTLTPVLDPMFDDYDMVLYVDSDVYPSERAIRHADSIFEAHQYLSFDICVAAEPIQPAQRAKFRNNICGINDERWARIINEKFGISVPKDEKGTILVYNAGVVLYSRWGIRHARERFVSIKEYVDTILGSRLPHFYSHDQNYLHAMMTRLNWHEFDTKWNSIVSPHWKTAARKELFYNDGKVYDTALVHIQLKRLDEASEDFIEQVVNKPLEFWRDRL